MSVTKKDTHFHIYNINQNAYVQDITEMTPHVELASTACNTLLKTLSNFLLPLPAMQERKRTSNYKTSTINFSLISVRVPRQFSLSLRVTEY